MANIIPTSNPVVGAGPFTWSYNFQLSSDQDVHSGALPTGDLVDHADLTVGSFVTVYDFAGYVGASCTGPLGWTCSAQNTGYTPIDVSPHDDPNLPNLTWVYTTGPTLTGQPNGLDLGVFSAQSAYGTSVLDSYTARAVKNNGGAIDTIADNVGNTLVPLGLTVPEPTSLVLAGLALLLMRKSLTRRTHRA